MDVGQLQARVEKAAERAITHLWDRQREDGSWVDRLSSSTIATALGALSLNRADPHLYKDRVESAVQWLRQYQREDGGWAMADAEWPSSPGMTAFGLAALHEIDPDRSHGAIERARVFIDENDGMNVIPGLTGEAPKTWPAALPTIWALTGLRDFEQQPDLPVETMLIPPRWRNKVSIALPAILGLGVMQARTMKRNPLRRILSRIAEPMALNWLREISGTNGGIEECPMIAGFVYLGLRQAGVGQDLQLASLRYLLETQRADGSWAIDRDLEISVTAYSIMALSEFQDVATGAAAARHARVAAAQPVEQTVQPVQHPGRRVGLGQPVGLAGDRGHRRRAGRTGRPWRAAHAPRSATRHPLAAQDAEQGRLVVGVGPGHPHHERPAVSRRHGSRDHGFATVRGVGLAGHGDRQGTGVPAQAPAGRRLDLVGVVP